MGALGLLGVTADEEYGGLGLGYPGARGGHGGGVPAPPPRWAFPTAPIRTSASYQIRRWGNPDQKARYLPKLISGEHVGALAMSEAGSGSDVISMRLRPSGAATAMC